MQVEELRRQREAKLRELETIKNTSPKDFWKKDLEVVMQHWEAG